VKIKAFYLKKQIFLKNYFIDSKNSPSCPLAYYHSKINKKPQNKVTIWNGNVLTLKFIYWKIATLRRNK